MKRLLLIVSFFFLITSGFAQKRADNWCFGRNAWLNFSSGSPVSQDNCLIIAAEASATVSDLSGNLLFYTDGETIRNSSHSVISNGTGINGYSSATQGAIFIPKPGSKTIVYLFTIDDAAGNVFNLYLTEIDATLNNGQGGVTSNKNILIKSGISERMAATWRADGTGIWLTVRDANDTKFHSFLITSAGIQPTPISSTAGSGTSTTPGIHAGQMKFTADGRYLAWACKGDRFVEVLQFDNQNGTFNSNWSRKVNVNYLWERPYGVEFSANGGFLYISAIGTPGIFQYDMSKLVSESLFRQSKVQISTAPAHGMQLASDGRIYIAVLNSYYLHAILSPELAGTACDYEANAVSLGTSISRDGTPSFISTYFLEDPIFHSDSCLGRSVSFKYMLEWGDSLRWNFGDPASGANTSTSVSPSHTYTTTGDYEVSLTIYHEGSPQTLYHNVRIHGFPEFSLGNDVTICYGDQYLLSPSVSYASYLWQDGRTVPVYNVLNTGTYHVKVEKYGCASYDTVNIIVDRPQVELVTSAENVCVNNNNFEYTFNQAGTVGDILWKFGDGVTATNRQVTHSYQMAGEYRVELQTTNANGCVAKTETQLVVKDIVPAVLHLNDDRQCLTGNNFEVSFDGDVYNPDLLSYTIAFSDGFQKNDASLAHAFNTPGQKNVVLMTTTKDYCMDTAAVDLMVFANPVADFTIDSTFKCDAGALIQVNGGISSSANGPVSKWLFSSHDMQRNGSTTAFGYTASGTYEINLSIEDEQGCTATKAKTVVIYPNPVVDFRLSEDNNCIGTKPVQAKNLTSIPSGSVTSYLWDFGNGETSTDFEPLIQFAQAKTYVVKLIAVSDKGCSTVHSRNVVSYEVPVADFTLSDFEPCYNENSLSLTNNSTISGNGSLSYEWNLDGNKFTSTDVGGFSFDSEGAKLITLKVTSDKGCFDEKQTSVLILTSPAANFKVAQPVQCLTDNNFQLQFVPEVETSPIESVVWTLSDGREFTSNNPEFSLYASGVYSFQLEVTNRVGCTAVSDGAVTVSPQPRAAFTADAVCRSTPMNFVNNSQIQGGSITGYAWFFGDDEQSTDAQPSHKYAQPGEYPVTLEVTSDMGCKDYLVEKVLVKDEPVATFHFRKFGYKADLAETVYEFVCDDYTAGSQVSWFVNGHKTATGERAFIGFKDTGYHNVTMLVENGQGCPGSSQHNVFVIPPFELYMPTAFSPNGDGLNEVFRPEGNTYIGTYEMIVVNRWGSVIFQSHSADHGWDGKFSGEFVEDGVYLYYIHLTDVEGQEWKFKGSVLLIK